MAFLTIDQAAQQFGASKHTLRAVARAGKLPGCRKIGGRWYVHTATLEEYFRSSVPTQVA
jgi:excisionase family DNA binding protein